MDYYELRIETEGLGVELVEDKLTEMDINEFVVDDPNVDLQMMAEADGTEYVDREEILANSGRVASITVYTEQYEDAAAIRDEIHRWSLQMRNQMDEGAFGSGVDSELLGTMKIFLTKRGDEEWKDKWKAYFKPSHITEHIVVRPSWETYEPASEQEIVVTIDPGMAFGTGTHETTSLTVLLMEKYMKPDARVLDIGCGTGILSIIADRLGAGDVLGIDIDEDAVDASRKNSQLNKTPDSVRFQRGDLTEGVEYQADMVVANLLTPLVLRLSPDVPKHLASGGKYIISGILTEQAESVEDALTELGFSMLEKTEKGDWCAIAAKYDGFTS